MTSAQTLTMLLLIALLSGGCSFLSQSTTGLTDGQLQPCPNAPRCVSSLSDDPEHAVKPFRLTGDIDKVWPEISAAVAAMPRTRIIAYRHNYIHAEVISPWHVYTDDLELLLEPESASIHVRSSARIGYYDFEVNRERVEELRQTLQAAGLIQ